MKTKNVYQCDNDGWYVGVVLADESPLEPGVFLIPGNAYELEPPEFTAGQLARMVGNVWEVQEWPVPKDLPELPEPEEPKPPVFCTPAQGLVALFALKQITEDHVLEAISQIPDQLQQYTARIGYQHSTSWERGSPTMQAMAQLLQLSEEDLDALFSYAVTVQV